MRKWVVRCTIAVLVLGALWMLRVTVLAPEPLRVRTVGVERGQVEAIVTNTKAGAVRAHRHARLSAALAGSVTELAVRRGDRVVQGALLLRLDDAEPRARLELALRGSEVLQARRGALCIARDRAQREWQRNRELAERGLVSADLLDALQSARDLAEAECAVIAAQVQQAEAEVALARTELEKTILRAPFAGVVAEVSTEVGEWLSPLPGISGAPIVLELFDDATLYVAAPMDEVDAGVLRVGAAVEISVDSHAERTFAGRVARIAPYVLDIEQQNRTIEIEVEFETAETVPQWPGASADVEVVLEIRENVLRVPTSTLLEGQRVFVVDEGVLRERRVVSGLRNWDWTEVREGLVEGERIVASLDVVGVEAGRAVAIDDSGVGP